MKNFNKCNGTVLLSVSVSEKIIE